MQSKTDQYDETIDYCGPGFGLMTKLIPRKIGGVDINLICYRHDLAWGTTEPRYKAADQLFRNAIYRKYKELDKKVLGLFVSRLYYVAVRIGRAGRWVQSIAKKL